MGRGCCSAKTVKQARLKRYVCSVILFVMFMVLILQLKIYRTGMKLPADKDVVIQVHEIIDTHVDPDPAVVETSIDSTTRPHLLRYNVTSDGRISYRNITWYPPDCGSKLLVYVCNADRPCGGLADRQKGIMSMFILAILTNRTLVVNNTSPCDVETHLPPNLYDWTKCRSYITTSPNDSLTINEFIKGWHSPFTFPNIFRQYNGSDLWFQRVVNVRANTKLHKLMRANPYARRVIPWLVTKPEEDCVKDVMELLFSYNSDVWRVIHTYRQNNIKDKYMVCAHFRVGAKGAEMTYLKTDDIKTITSYMVAHMFDLNMPVVVYIATDSQEVKDRVKKIFPSALTLNSTIGHIDVYKQGASCDATFTSVLEQAMLSECDSVLLTWSGFSRMAVLRGGKASHIFAYRNSNNGWKFDNYSLHSMAEWFGIIFVLFMVLSLQINTYHTRMERPSNKHKLIPVHQNFGIYMGSDPEAVGTGIDPTTTPRLPEVKVTSDGRVNYKNITWYPPDCGSKLLVYVCNADRPCGGLADRQKGMVSTFILAILTNRTFVVNNTSPCDVETHLPPNLYDWAKCRSHITTSPNDSLTINDFIKGWQSPFTFKKVFKQYNGSDLWHEKVVNVRTNTKLYKLVRKNPHARKVIPWLFTKPEEDIVKDVMDLLFSYNSDIWRVIHTYRQRYLSEKHMLCAHFRVGAKGAERTYLKTDDIKTITSYMVAHMLDLNVPLVVYIATDSQEVKDSLKKIFPSALTLNSTIGHIDVRKQGASCEATFTSVLEQAMLSECDSILLGWSGFSRMAVLRGGKASHIYVYKKSNAGWKFESYSLHSLAEGFGTG